MNITAPIDDEIEDDYDDDVFDTKDDPQPEPKKIPAKRRSQSLSALKDKEEKSPKKVLLTIAELVNDCRVKQNLLISLWKKFSTREMLLLIIFFVHFVVSSISVEYKLAFVVKLINKTKCSLKYKNWYEMIVHKFIILETLKFVITLKILYSHE